MTETAYIALGSNLPSPVGSPRQTLDAALLRLRELGTLLAQSSYYETAPVGYANQPSFLNAAAALQTSLDAPTLLDSLLEIERSFGRDRTRAILNGPRTLDLDLLLYGNSILSTQNLRLPHPRMAERAFVLVPLREIAPELIHPEFNKSVSQLLKDLPKLKEESRNGGC
jgi:2-amino-4-hydroxy-6-hydroxymethyldihydropteridine diphosphokinase